MNEGMKDQSNKRSVDKQELASLVAAAEATFENAEALYNEAAVLAKAGHIARAVFLHQISLEECGKLEMLGAWIVGVLAGVDRDPKRFYRALGQHKAKNSANAYMLEVSGEELAAEKRGDWNAKGEAFDKMKGEFHGRSNRAKNSSLYVDINEREIETPKTSITADMLSDFKDRNERFLSLMHPKLEMIRSWRDGAPQVQASFQAFVQAMEKLRGSSPDLPKIMEVAIEEMKKAMRSSKKPAD